MADPQTFVDLRPMLFSIAYRMLGSVTDAEDVLQEAYLRWQQVLDAEVKSPRAFLATVTTRLCIDHLRSARARRETYVGPWLPEPLFTDSIPDLSEHAELADSISMAFLVLMESLTPLERAVFLLREVFAFPFGEIAGMVGRSEEACRQLATRARRHLDDGRPRFEADEVKRRELTQRFLAATAGGDVSTLIELLAEDVTLWTDGGGKAKAARRPILGASNVARFLVGIARDAPPDVEVRLAEVNGQPGVLLFSGGRPFAVLVLDLSEGRVQGAWLVVNPDKLAALARSSSAS